MSKRNLCLSLKKRRPYDKSSYLNWRYYDTTVLVNLLTGPDCRSLQTYTNIVYRKASNAPSNGPRGRGWDHIGVRTPLPFGGPSNVKKGGENRHTRMQWVLSHPLFFFLCICKIFDPVLNSGLYIWATSKRISGVSLPLQVA